MFLQEVRQVFDALSGEMDASILTTLPFGRILTHVTARLGRISGRQL